MQQSNNITMTPKLLQNKAFVFTIQKIVQITLAPNKYLLMYMTSCLVKKI